jgi:hypothetical protein
MLHRFLVRNRELVQGHQVLELGAGCGLSGLVASHFAAGTLLTDGNDIVLELLRQNAERQQAEGVSAGPVEARKLLWGSEESLREALGGGWRPQVLLGADIVCWPDYVAPLLQTVKRLLLDSPGQCGAMYLGFVCRAKATEALFLRTAGGMGMAVERIPAESFLPPEAPEEVRSANELQLLVVRLDPTSPHGTEEPVFETPPEGRTAPC